MQHSGLLEAPSAEEHVFSSEEATLQARGIPVAYLDALPLEISH